MGFGDSFRAGWALGLQGQRVGLEREKMEREQQDEALLAEARTALFAGAPDNGVPTATPTPTGLGEQKANTTYLGQLNGAVKRGLELMRDPKYARIGDKLLTEIERVTKSSGQFRDAMYAEARDNAMPYLQEYYTPGQSPDRKAKALSGLLTTVLPNGRDYTAKFVNGNVELQDDLGRVTVMPEKGVDAHIQRIMQNPDDFMAGIEKNISEEAKRSYEEWKHERERFEKSVDAEAEEFAKIDAERRAEGRTIASERRAEQRALATEGRTRNRDIEKENRAALRGVAEAREKFIAQGMQAFDSGMAMVGKDVTRDQYMKNLQRAAEESFQNPTLFDASGAPMGLPQPSGGPEKPTGRGSRYGAVGSTISVPDSPEEEGQRVPGQVNNPPGPQPAGVQPAAQPAGVPPPRPANAAPAQGITVVPTTGEKVTDAVVGAAKTVAGLPARAGHAIGQSIRTPAESLQGGIEEIRGLLSKSQVNTDEARKIRRLGMMAPRELRKLGLTEEEIRRLNYYRQEIDRQFSGEGLPAPQPQPMMN